MVDVVSDMGKTARPPRRLGCYEFAVHATVSRDVFPFDDSASDDDSRLLDADRARSFVSCRPSSATTVYFRELRRMRK